MVRQIAVQGFAVGMGVVHDRDNVHHHRLVAKIANNDIPDLTGAVQRHKNRHIGLKAIELRDDAGIPQVNPAFELLKKFQRKNEERRENAEAIRRMPVQVQGLPLKSEAGSCWMYFEIRLKVGSSLQIKAPPVWSTKPPNSRMPM